MEPMGRASPPHRTIAETSGFAVAGREFRGRFSGFGFGFAIPMSGGFGVWVSLINTMKITMITTKRRQ